MFFNGCNQGVIGVTNVDAAMANAQMFNELHAVVDVGLDSIGHGHADDTVHTEGFGTETCDDTTVLAARNADDGVAAFSIHFKPVANPLDDLVFYLFCVKCIHVVMV